MNSKQNEDRLRDLWDNIKHKKHLHYRGFRGEERKGQRTYLK